MTLRNAFETLATEATLDEIASDTDKLDIALSALRDALKGASNKTLTDVVNSLGAIAGTVIVSNLPSDQLIHATNLDIAISALRDALRGGSSKTLTDVVNAIGATLAVSGTVSVGNFPLTQAVTGPLTDTQLRASRVPVDGSGVTQPVSGVVGVSGIAGTIDIADRSGRLVGHVVIDSMPDVVFDNTSIDINDRTGRLLGHINVDNFPSDQLVHATNLDLSISGLRDALRGISSKTLTDVANAIGATLNADVSDRSGRLLGHVTVDNSSLAVTGTFYQATQPVSGPLTDTQLRASAVPVSGPATDAELRATPLPVSGTVTASGPLTDTQLRATAVPVSGTVTASGPLTDTQLRASAVPVSGPVTDAELRATPLPVSGTVTASGPLTDTQLRASAVPVSGPATDTQLRATPLPVSGTVTASGPVTDTQLRASAVPISQAAPSTVVNGGKKVAVSHTAVAIAVSTAVSAVIVTASSTNTASIFVGASTVTDDYHTATSGVELQPGGSIGLAIDNLSKVYVNGTANDGVSFLGS